MTVRDAADEDLRAIHQIYAAYVLESLATFEEEPPSIEELHTRWRATMEAGVPYLVAVSDGEVAGFAYASPYRTRPAYRFTVEDSVYVRQDLQRHGAGTVLLRT